MAGTVSGFFTSKQSAGEVYCKLYSKPPALFRIWLCGRAPLILTQVLKAMTSGKPNNDAQASAHAF